MLPHRDERLSPHTRRILHLDVDAFLASVEQALHPELRGRAVIVGGPPTSRNLVMSCSYPARRRGVCPGMFAAEAARRCPEGIFVPGNSQAANQMREQVVRILLDTSPRVQVTSIDDFLIDLTGSTRLLGSAFDVAQILRTRIFQETHLPVSIGIGTGPMLARLAGKWAKPGGVAEVLPGYERSFLARLSIHDLPGVGHRIGRALTSFSIRTVGELALVSREVLFASFGPCGLTLHDRALGLDDESLQATHHISANGELSVRPPKSIQRDSTFEPEEGRPARIEAMLGYLVERAAVRLRQHGLEAGSLEVRLVYVDTRSARQRPQRQATSTAGMASRTPHKRQRLPEASANTQRLSKHALQLLQSLPQRRALVKRIGITLLTLKPRRVRTGQLFSDDTCDERLDEAVDRVRERHGFGQVMRASSLLLSDHYPAGPEGLQLRTPSLNQ